MNAEKQVRKGSATAGNRCMSAWCSCQVNKGLPPDAKIKWENKDVKWMQRLSWIFAPHREVRRRCEADGLWCTTGGRCVCVCSERTAPARTLPPLSKTRHMHCPDSQWTPPQIRQTWRDRGSLEWSHFKRFFDVTSVVFFKAYPDAHFHTQVVDKHDRHHI